MNAAKILVLALAATLAGCATVGHEIDQSQIEKIHKGETRKTDILKMLGTPDQVTSDGTGVETFQYLYAKATVKGASFIPIVGMFVGGTNIENKTVQVTFDSNGVVKNVSTSHGATESSMYGNSSQRTIPPPVNEPAEQQ